MEIIFWILLLTWAVNRVVIDGLYALQGKPSPRYELAKAKAAAAGKPAPTPARYGTKQWWDDLYSDALAANTRWRRNRRPGTVIEGRIDDLADAVREPRTPADNKRTRPTGGPTSSVVHTDQHPYCLTSCGDPTCPAGRPRFGWNCDRCGVDRGGFASEAEARADATAHPCQPTNQPDNVVSLFPNLEVVMSNGTDVNGLAAAQAFAAAAAEAHESFATGGSEGYTNALAGFEVGDECIGLAREAQEASRVAAAKWAAHLEALTKQNTVKEAYQGVPDAGNKNFLLNG